MAALDATALDCLQCGIGVNERISGFKRQVRFNVRLSLTMGWLVFLGIVGKATCQQPAITMLKSSDRVTVRIGNEAFTEYLFSGFQRPILYPLNAVDGQSVVRNYPMLADVAGEASDHPHHQSVWFAHGDVNGLDFWSNKAIIRNLSVSLLADGIVSHNEWVGTDTVVCSDQTVIRFDATDSWRMVDYDVQITAGKEAVSFNDTKEGLFAIRTHPRLRIQDVDGNSMASAFNSEGVSGKDIWGKSARWVHYQNHIGDQVFGVTVMDAPTNFRHPNYWHAREYGLIAANPFGLHDLAGLPAGSGSLTLGPGQSISLRYAIIVWNTAATADEIEKVFAKFGDRSHAKPAAD